MIAFSLIEIALVLVLAALMTGYALQTINSGSATQCYEQTKAQMAVIDKAIEYFAQKFDRFPMPALRSLGVEDTGYGREVDSTDLVNMAKLDQVDGVTYGALPFQALGIPVANAADCWGNKFTYAVTTDLTDSSKFLNSATNGAINIKSSTTNVFLIGTSYVVISHGEDQLGAVKANYRDTSVPPNNKWCTYDAAKPLKTENCEISVAHGADIISAEFNNGRDAGANYFDDIVIYRGRPFIPPKTCECTGPGPVDVFTAKPLENFIVSPICN